MPSAVHAESWSAVSTAVQHLRLHPIYELTSQPAPEDAGLLPGSEEVGSGQRQ